MHFRLLTQADEMALFRAFNLAFSQYIVKIQLTETQYKTKLQREGIQLEHCAGAFSDDEEMVGFIMTSVRNWDGKITAYNAGTGVIPAFRGQGITTDLYKFLLEHLRQQKVQQCQLEVIDNNIPALHIYTQMGFSKTRLLHCFRGAKSSLQIGNLSAEGVKLKQVTEPDFDLYKIFWDALPSWQNSTDSVQASPEEKFVVEARMGEKCVGYGVIFKESGGVAQIAVAKEFRNKSIGSGILQALIPLTESPNLTFLNVPANCKSLLSFLENRQVPPLLNQLEMKLMC